MDRLAMYLRLSLEDKRAIEDGGSAQDESNSIGNQRKQILEYIHHDSELSQYEVMEFSDDADIIGLNQKTFDLRGFTD